MFFLQRYSINFLLECVPGQECLTSHGFSGLAMCFLLSKLNSR